VPRPSVDRPRRLKIDELPDFELVLGHGGEPSSQRQIAWSLLESSLLLAIWTLKFPFESVDQFLKVDIFWKESRHHSRKVNWIGLGKLVQGF
jgi:hypothetical protein